MYMKKNRITTIALGILMASCSSSDFDLSTFDSTPFEADIKYVCMDANILKNPSDTLHDASKFVVEDVIEIPVNSKADLTKLAPKFVLTNGSQIFMQDSKGEWTIPANGKERDFSNQETGQKYMVVSANGQSHHIYSLIFNCTEIPSKYSLDYSELNDTVKNPRYYVFKEYDDKGNYILTWCTANPGFGISRSKADPMEYPSIPCEGHDGNGHGVALTTSLTGSIASMMNMPIAAGNLFLGNFNTVTALRAPLESTQFGVPYNKRPLKIMGYMNYVPGEKYTNRKMEVIDRADSCSIYAILFKNYDADHNTVILDGTNVDNCKYIVAKAEISDKLKAGTNGKWEYFEADFDFDSYTTPFVPEISEENGYSITIVCSSSTQGAYFMGAVGSRLKVDEITLVGE